MADRSDIARLAVRLGVYRQARATFRWLGGDHMLRFLSSRRAAAWVGQDIAHPIARHGLTQIEMHVLADDPRAHKLAVNQGMLDRHLCRLWNQLISNVQPDAVLDIGANYGEVAFSTTSYGVARVILIEPNPRIAECLTRTVVDHGLTNIEVHAVAAGDATETAYLHTLAESSGLASLHESDCAQRVAVPVVRVEDLFSGPRPARLVAKIDVEGHELAVLDGMKSLLEACEHYEIICEYVNLTHDELCLLSERHEVALVNRYTLDRRATSADELSRLRAAPGLGPYLKDALLTPL